jgi:hypothetical protein
MAAVRRARRPSRRLPRKDRLVQTRVPRNLEETLKREARRRRVTVSHLIRSLIEDTFQLVDGVVADVDQIVSDSMSLVRSVGRSARRLAKGHRSPRESAAPGSDLSDVYAWNEVVLQRTARCTGCGAVLGRGRCAFAGLSDDPGAPRRWLCASCIDALGAGATD